MAKSENSDTMSAVEENVAVAPEQVVWEPSDVEPLKTEVQEVEEAQDKPVITPVDTETTKENGELNGSVNEGIIEEPESEPEINLNNASTNIVEMPSESPTIALDTPGVNPESSGDDEPLSNLTKPIEETRDLLHAVPSPNPFANIRGRPGLRSASPFRTHSVPTSPQSYGFPPLTRVDGQLSLQKETDRKRPRAESPTQGQNNKRSCRAWPGLANWWNGEGKQQSATDALANPSPRACALM